MIKQCKECKYSKADKYSDTVYCNVLGRTLIFNRADKCELYEDSSEIRKAKAKGTYNSHA